MKLIASIMRAELQKQNGKITEGAVSDYLQSILEQAYKEITGERRSSAFFNAATLDGKKDYLFARMKKIDSSNLNRISFGVEVIVDMIDDFFDSKGINESSLREDDAIQNIGKKLLSKSKGDDSQEATAKSDGASDELPKDEPKADEPKDDETKEPELGQKVRILIGDDKHKGEIHEFVGMDSQGRYKLKLIGVDKDKIKYKGGVGAIVKTRKEFELVEGLLSSFFKRDDKPKLDRQPLTKEDRIFITSVFNIGHNADMTFASGEYVLPDNITVNYKKGRINFYKDGDLIRASVGFYEDESGPGNPRQSPMISEDFEVRTKADLEKIKKAISY